MTQDTNTTSGAAIQRYKIGYHADECDQRSSTPSSIPDASGSWVRYADHVTALAAGQAVVQDGVAALVIAAQAFVLEPDWHKKKLELEAMAWGLLAAATQPTQPTRPAPAPAPAPVLWVSPEQFANFMDADEAPFGKYVPARKTCAGNFTMPLFAAPAPAPEQPAAPKGDIDE